MVDLKSIKFNEVIKITRIDLKKKLFIFEFIIDMRSVNFHKKNSTLKLLVK